MEANDEPILAFTAGEAVPPGLELRVNFGVFAGRTVTSAEIDRLAQLLLDEVEGVTVISEERHEIGRAAEASAHRPYRARGRGRPGRPRRAPQARGAASRAG